MTFRAIRFFLIATGLFLQLFSPAQITIPPSNPNDTTRMVEIVKSDVYREKKIDSLTKLQILAGHVIVKEGTTTFSTDSAVINRRLNTVNAYGNVHINESDSIHTFARYLTYVGSERKAYLKQNVTLLDRKGKLTTQELIYDLATGVGIYKNGGRIVNKTTVLTSREGTYLSETKDVFFRNDVHLVDPKYDIKADSLQYNTLTEVVNFTGPTFIKSKEADIYTTSGYYDLKQGKAFFGSNPLITDSARRKYSAENIAMDEKSHTIQLERNAIIKDSANGYTVTGGQIFINTQVNNFLATRKPVLIIQQKDDSTYIAADTLFSGVRPRSKKAIPDGSDKSSKIADSLRRMANPADTLKNLKPALESIKKDSLPARDTTVVRVWPPMTDSTRTDTLKAITTISGDSLNRALSKNDSDTAIRFFLAFAHVRIFNDSLQAVCDSLSYSAEDSVFRMYKNPVAWNAESQVAGDTIYMFTKNKKAERLYVFENAIVINKIEKDYYNQISGRNLNAYFINGNIDYIRTKGVPAESAYYIRDNDSAYVGMNRAEGSVIDLYFVKKQLNKVLFVKDVKGTMHPIRQIPADQKYLKNFKWQDARRPRSRLELFE